MSEVPLAPAPLLRGRERRWCRLCSATVSVTSPTGSAPSRPTLYLTWPLRERGFPVIVEELDCALQSGVAPVEFPTVLTTREQDQRPSAFPYSPRVILTYLRYPCVPDEALRRRLGRGER